MILPALVALYERLLAEPESDLPRPGWSRRSVAFALELSPDGEPLPLHDLRKPDSKRMLPVGLVVPDHGETRTSAAKDQPYFLCDATAFILGGDDKKGDKAAAYFASARKLHLDLLAGCDDPGAVALRRFFERWDTGRIPDIVKNLNWVKDVSGTNLVFRLTGQPGFLHQRPALARLWQQYFDRRSPSERGQCLVTGEVAPIARTHPGIKLPGTTGNGAMMVSFNAGAFTSYGHDQGMNAPVSEYAMFAYSTALSELLRPVRRQRVQLGNTTLLFWADRPCEEESLFPSLLDGGEADVAAESRLHKAVRDLRDGRGRADSLAGIAADSTFHILGIDAPGGSRVAIRFWFVSTLGELLERVADHQRALRIEKSHPERDHDLPGSWQLLRAATPPGRDAKPPAPLQESFLRAVLTGAPYPTGLMARVLDRIRSEYGPYESVSYLRVALLKACLTRPKSTWEPPMTLNPEDNDSAYRLGRLFAALERAQQLALGHGLNATIKDRYFGTASASPKAVFPNLIRLAQHHLSKAENSGWLDGLIGQIMEGLTAFPAHLALDAQARFALGYYHQRNDLWRSKKQPES
jgi:CRISPR-associated protein Csd1